MRKAGLVQDCEEGLHKGVDTSKGQSGARGSRPRKKSFYKEQVIKSADCYSEAQEEQYSNTSPRLSRRNTAGDKTTQDAGTTALHAGK